MSKNIKIFAALGLMSFAAACAQPEPEYVEVQPISTEPVYTGKYK